MVSAAQNRANLRSAERLVAIALGVDNQDGSRPTMDYATSLEYLRRLAATILAHPDSFTSATLETARVVNTQNLSPLDDASFSYSDFTTALVDEAVSAGESVAGVGQGVLSAASAMKYVIPVVVIGGVLFIAWRYVNAVPMPAQRKART